MALRSNGPVMLALPPFRGVTRQLVLTAAIVFLATLALGMISPGIAHQAVNYFQLHPDHVRHGFIWELFTYPLINGGLLNTLFALLSVWFFGSALEDDMGSAWLTNYLLVVTVGGGLLTVLLSHLLNRFVAGFDPTQIVFGLWPAVMALVLAFARLHPDQELNFNFIFRIKAKYMAAIYLLVYLALSLTDSTRLPALTALTNALAGYLFLRSAGRHGLRYSASERWFGLRNAYAKAQRRRAAKRFQVYMREQGRDVRFDADGKLIEDDDRPRPGTSDDGRPKWMN